MTVHYEIPVEPENTDCPQCGRDSGHHLGCANAGKPFVLPEDVQEPEVAVCAADGCQDAPKPYGGKGPRPKFCAAHGK